MSAQPLRIARWQWLQLVASEDGPAEAATRHVLLTLSLHMNQDGSGAFPSQQLLATRTGLSERSVRSHLKAAEAAGWLRRQSKNPGGQGWRLHEYLPDLPPVVAEGAATAAARHAEDVAERAAMIAAPREQRAATAAAPPTLRAATNDTTCGNLRPNVRQPLPLTPRSTVETNRPERAPARGESGGLAGPASLGDVLRRAAGLQRT